jgi:hypothetical protein
MTTFSSLLTAAVAFGEDDSTEYAAYFPIAVSLAEERLARDLGGWGMVVQAYTTVSAGDPFIVKPSAHRATKHLSFTTDDGEQFSLDMKTDDYIRDYWPIRSSVGTPKFYANWNSRLLIIAPTPVSAVRLESSYVVKPSALVSTSQESNWFTEFAAEALYFAVMVEMMRFARNKEYKDDFEASYQMSLAGLRNEDRRNRRDDRQAPDSAGTENNVEV